MMEPDKSWNFIYEADCQEIQLLIDAYNKSAKNKIGNEERISSLEIIRIIQNIFSENKREIGYDEVIKIIADNLGLKSYQLTIESERAILSHLLVLCLKNSSSQFVEEFYKSEGLVNKDWDKLEVEAFVRACTSTTFDSRLPYMVAQFTGVPIKQLPPSFGIRYYYFLALAFPILGVLPLAIKLVFDVVQIGKKTKQFWPLITIMILLRREHTYEFSNAEEVIRYIDTIILNDKTHATHSETAKSMFVSILSFEAKTNMHIRASLLEWCERNIGLPSFYFPDYKLEKMKPYMNNIVDYLIQRIFDNDNPDIYASLNETLHRYESGTKLLFSYMIGYTHIDAKTVCYPLERQPDSIISLYYMYHGLDEDKICRVPKDDERFDLVVVKEESEITTAVKYCKREGQIVVLSPELVLLDSINVNVPFFNESFPSVVKRLVKDTDSSPQDEELKRLKQEIESLNEDIKRYERNLHYVRHNCNQTLGIISNQLRWVRNHDGNIPMEKVKNAEEWIHILSERLSKIGKVNYGEKGKCDLMEALHSVFESDDYPYNIIWEDKCSTEEKYISFSADNLRIDVLQNLQSNIVKHGFGGSLLCQEKSKKMVKISINDNGNFYEVRISNNGNPFEGSDSQTKDVFDYGVAIGKVKGTGLGMYSVYEYVRHFGGNVDFVSAPNCEFKVTYIINFLKY